MFVKIPAEALINRLGMNLELDCFEALEVSKDPQFAKVNVRIKPVFYRANRAKAKATINSIRDCACQEGLDAHYELRGRWLIIAAKAAS